MERTYHVYMTTNVSPVVLSVGVTNDLARRVWQHQQGKCPGFTKRYHLNRLAYCEPYPYVLDAIAREKEIKGWTRVRKNALVETLNPSWSDLAASYFEPSHVARDPSLRSG